MPLSQSQAVDVSRAVRTVYTADGQPLQLIPMWAAPFFFPGIAAEGEDSPPPAPRVDSTTPDPTRPASCPPSAE